MAATLSLCCWWWLPNGQSGNWERPRSCLLIASSSSQHQQVSAKKKKNKHIKSVNEGSSEQDTSLMTDLLTGIFCEKVKRVIKGV